MGLGNSHVRIDLPNGKGSARTRRDRASFACGKKSSAFPERVASRDLVVQESTAREEVGLPCQGLYADSVAFEESDGRGR